MLKKLGIPVFALGAMLALAVPHPATAGGVHFGITVGNPNYDYPAPYYYGYPTPYSYSYANPYDGYPYSYLSVPFWGGHEHHEHEHYEHRGQGNRAGGHEHGGHEHGGHGHH